MRLTIDKSDLHSALSAVSRAVKGHPTLPTLGGVLMRAEGDRLHLTGTDLDLTIEATVPARVEEDGEVILPGKPLLEIVRRLSGGEVRIVVDDQNATIACGRSRFTLHGMAPRLFPSVTQEVESTLLVSPWSLQEILGRVAFAVSRDESRPILTGVSVQVDGHRVRAIATDGFRVAVSDGELGSDTGGRASVVIPGQAVSELLRIDTNGQPRIVGLGGGRARFDFGAVRLTTRLIDGQHPDVLSLLPSEYPHKVRVQRQELLAALERAALVSGYVDRERHLVRLDIAEDRITITARDPELGDAREEVPAQLQGEGMTIGFNARYLIDGLKVIGSEEVEIGLTGPLQAAQIRGVDEAGFRYIVLPVKLGDREGVPF